jgi:hypothetical protein
MSIWMLVEECAKELTENGNTPFTRIDLIRGVQRKNPSYGPNSIRPIIQGLTDNLKGGAPGAVGKNILHSVGRGLFVLSDKSQINSKSPVSKAPPQISRSVISRTPFSSRLNDQTTQYSGSKVQSIGGYDFTYVCAIEPERNSDGTVLTFMPQSSYANIDNLPLNKYGSGPFCKFKIPRNMEYPGVYALVDENVVKYIGESVGLTSRFNMGYGIISPRNCFVGGQETNCRVNNLLLRAISAGSKITLWFYNTPNHKSIEEEIRSRLLFSWNRI